AAQRRPAAAAAGIDRRGASAAAHIAAARAAPAPAAPSRGVPGQKDFRKKPARAATTFPDRTPQKWTGSAPAPRPAARGASKATRQRRTWLLTRTQLNWCFK